MLRFFGHERVSVLSGGLKSWLSIGGITASGPVEKIKKGDFTVGPAVGAKIISFDSLRRLIETGDAGQIADARSSNRFKGIDPEPRPGLRGGHMDGASNVPISKLIDESGGLRPVNEIASAFIDAGINIEQSVITTCGSGITACGLALGLALLGNEDVLVYDGSWAEWGASDAPVIKNDKG